MERLEYGERVLQVIDRPGVLPVLESGKRFHRLAYGVGGGGLRREVAVCQHGRDERGERDGLFAVPGEAPDVGLGMDPVAQRDMEDVVLVELEPDGGGDGGCDVSEGCFVARVGDGTLEPERSAGGSGQEVGRLFCGGGGDGQGRHTEEFVLGRVFPEGGVEAGHRLRNAQDAHRTGIDQGEARIRPVERLRVQRKGDIQRKVAFRCVLGL